MDDSSTFTFNIAKGQLRAAACFVGGCMAGYTYAKTGDATALLTSFEGLTGIVLAGGGALWSGIAWWLTDKKTAPVATPTVPPVL